MAVPMFVVGAGVLVHKRGKLLMVKRAEEPDIGMWSFPGGMVEANETPAEAAKREALEEVGLRVELEGVFEVVVYPRSEKRPNPTLPLLIVDYLAKPSAGRVKMNAESSGWGWFTPDQIQRLRANENVKACARRFAALGRS